jgi:YD repeat-containing protein
MRARQSTAAASTRITFSGGEADGIPVVGGTTYYIKGYAARGTVSRTDMISSMTIEWFNDDEASISTSTTANTNLTTANTWYLVSGSAAAPATAVRATIRMSYARSGGGNISVGDRLWGDAFSLSTSTASYFDGDFPTSTTYLYGWTGGVGTSPSYRVDNTVDDLAQDILTKYSTTSMRVTRIRWNAQEQLSSIPALSVGKSISLIYKGTTTTHRIVGIDASIDPERYMIDYYLIKD